MSDLLAVEQQTRNANSWRGSTDVSFGEEDDDGDPITYELKYRQLYDDEFGTVINKVGEDEFEDRINSLGDATEDMSQSELEELRDLQGSDPEDMSEDDRERLNDLMGSDDDDDDDDGGVFGLMNPRMIDGLQYAAKQGVVPDEDDVDEVLNMRADKQEQRFGDISQDADKARDVLQESVDTIVERSTGFTAYKIGLDVLMDSMGATGN